MQIDLGSRSPVRAISMTFIATISAAGSYFQFGQPEYSARFFIRGAHDLDRLGIKRRVLQEAINRHLPPPVPTVKIAFGNSSVDRPADLSNKKRSPDFWSGPPCACAEAQTYPGAR